jgi:hypothetical protein
MTGPVPAMPPPGRPSRADLTVHLFRALYKGFDLHAIGGIRVAVPKGTPCYAGPSLGAIARQISAASASAPGPARPGQPRPAGTST